MTDQAETTAGSWGFETNVPVPFLIHVPIPPGLVNLDGLKREVVSALACVFIEAKPATLEKLHRFLGRHNYEFWPFLDVTALTAKSDVEGLIDGGARVFVKPEQLTGLADHGSRVAPVVSGSNARLLDQATEAGLLITDFDMASSDVDHFAEVCQKKKLARLFIKPVAKTSYVEFVEFCRKCGAHPILTSTELTTDPEDPARLPISKVIASFWRTDRADGLIPTVVCEEGGIALGLVYSNEESVLESLRTGMGVYQSRTRGLWRKGLTSGNTQELVRISLDCDGDALRFIVKQKGRFCHLEQTGCFGELRGAARLEQTLKLRKEWSPAGSYTARLFQDPKLLKAKIMEEAEELCNANDPGHVAFELADLMYFGMVKAVHSGSTLTDVWNSLDAKSYKVKRRPGDAKEPWAKKVGISTAATQSKLHAEESLATSQGRITMKRLDASKVTITDLQAALKRPSQKSATAVMATCRAIIDDVRANGDDAVLNYTRKFDKATSLKSPVIKAPFPESLMEVDAETKTAIDISFENIKKFHVAQADETLRVETMPGVVCTRFSRPIQRVGLYVPGGNAVLPSTALMLGVPALVAGCSKIVIASPPRADGSISPEIVYVAHKVGAQSIVLAGGAQAVAAMAYGTRSVSKVDKILGPGNQYVTAAKMHVSMDANAGVSIDMPAGPSEVLVIADRHANPAFVASDLLSQAEHGADSQVVLIAVDLDEAALGRIEDELHNQALVLPRVDVVRQAIAHSITVQVRTIEEAMKVSNNYAPEHLILQVENAEKAVELVMNAGSVFIGPWTPESVGDYSAGVNHSLPTYGYARQYSGVSLSSFVKHITSSQLTEQGLKNVAPAVIQLAKVEQLEAHKRAVEMRLAAMKPQAER